MHCLPLRSATLSVMTAVNCGLPMSDVHAYCWSGGTKLLHQDLRVECPSNKMVSITNLDNLDSNGITIIREKMQTLSTSSLGSGYRGFVARCFTMASCQTQTASKAAQKGYAE